jgi:hypothetical protein
MELAELTDKMKLKDKTICFSESSFDDWTVLPDGFGDSKGGSAKYTQKTEKKWLGLAKNEGLQSYIASVDVALIDGNYFKITGLIRNGLWNKDLLEKPDALTLCVYSLEQSAYDNLISTLYPISIKNRSQEQVLACYKRLGLTFDSNRLKHGYITEAINIALRGEPRALQDKRSLRNEINIDSAIEAFQEELMLIDKINPDVSLFSTGILAAALLMLCIDPQIIEFFTRLNSLQGETKNERNDPVESLLRIIESMKKKATSEGKFQVELCAKTIRAIQAWNAGAENDRYWLKRLNSVDFLPNIRKMKSIKGIHGNMGL